LCGAQPRIEWRVSKKRLMSLRISGPLISYNNWIKTVRRLWQALKLLLCSSSFPGMNERATSSPKSGTALSSCVTVLRTAEQCPDLHRNDRFESLLGHAHPPYFFRLSPDLHTNYAVTSPLLSGQVLSVPRMHAQKLTKDPQNLFASSVASADLGALMTV
jgi:hypothetical protein